MRSRLVVVMGVSGAGKTAVGSLLAERLGVEYADGDHLHPAENVARMEAGIPLTDEQRWPWLREVGRWLAEHAGTGGVISCSALRRAYRDVLVDAAPEVFFLHLSGDPELIRGRMQSRQGHYMPASLLDSQLATLEPLEPDENGLVADVAGTPEEIVSDFLSGL
jgi:gluconokinase